MVHLREVSGMFLRRGAAVLWRAAAWPARIAAARETMRHLAGMSDYELADIGLNRQDLRDAAALALDADPSLMFSARAEERKRAPLRMARAGAAKGPNRPMAPAPLREPVSAE